MFHGLICLSVDDQRHRHPFVSQVSIETTSYWLHLELLLGLLVQLLQSFNACLESNQLVSVLTHLLIFMRYVPQSQIKLVEASF